MKRLQRPACRKMSLGLLDDSLRASCQLDQIGEYCSRRHVIQLGGRFEAEPAEMLFPDCTDDPGYFAVPLPDGQLRWKLNTAHQGPQIDPGIHSLEGTIPDELCCITDARELAADLFGTFNRLAMTGDERLWVQVNDALYTLDEPLHVADLVATHRVKIGDVAEQGSGQIAGEGDTLARHPHHERVEGLAPGCRVKLEPAPAELKRIRVMEGGCDHRFGALGHLLFLVVAPESARTACHRCAQAAPVLADMGEIRLSNRLGAGRVDPTPAAYMIVMALGKDDLFDGIATNRAQPPEVFLGVEDDPGVHQYIALGRQDPVGVGDIA